MPSAPTTSPSASPASPRYSFLHVLHGQSKLQTYRIDESTGQLNLSVEQSSDGAQAIAGNPRGNFVFLAYPNNQQRETSIAALTPDSVTGRLTQVSAQRSNPMQFWSGTGRWEALWASERRVFGMWSTITYHDLYQDLETHSVTSAGELGPDHLTEWGEFDPEGVAIDVEEGGVYKAVDAGGAGGLFAYSVDENGALHQVASSRRCGATPIRLAIPVLVANGVVFGKALTQPDFSLCSWTASGLVPLANLGPGRAAAPSASVRPATPRLSADAAGQVATALVAMTFDGTGTESRELRLFAPAGQGELRQLDAVRTSPSAQGVLFNPSGRFLYVSLNNGSLLVFFISVEGRLEKIQEIREAAGRLAWSSPAS